MSHLPKAAGAARLVAAATAALLLAIVHALLILLTTCWLNGFVKSDRLGGAAMAGAAAWSILTVLLWWSWHGGRVRRRGGRRALVHSPRDVLDAGFRCVHCGYDLRTLRAGGRCPECGKPVMATLTAADGPVRPGWWSRALAGWLAVASVPILLGLVPEVVRGPLPASGVYRTLRLEQEQLLWSGVIAMTATVTTALLVNRWRTRRLTWANGWMLVPAAASALAGVASCLVWLVRWFFTGRSDEFWVFVGVFTAACGVGFGLLLRLLAAIVVRDGRLRVLPLAAYWVLVGLAGTGLVALLLSMYGWY